MKENLKLNFTRKGFEEFCFALNHRMTRIESDMKWMKRIGYYLSTIITAVGLKLVVFGA